MSLQIDLDRAHEHCGRNRVELGESELCGCFHCEAIFTPNEIVEWCDEGDSTAICPNCSIDAVVGDASGFAITPEFLSAMHEHWFETTVSPEEMFALEWERTGFWGRVKMRFGRW